MIHIALCTDNHYATACLACATSVLENNQKNDVSIYILTKEISEEYITYFNNLSQKYNRRIEIITISSEHFSHLKISDRFRDSIYYRFLIPDLIDAEKVLYLDADTIVVNDLKDLWDMDLDNFACGAIEDQANDDIRIHNRTETDNPYFNSGVLLINSRYWREHNLNQKLTKFIYDHPEKCVYPDQDALNIILNGKIRYLPYRYNFQDRFYLTTFDDLYIDRKKWSKILKEKETATIIHFTAIEKPWHIECNHPLKEEFYKYITLSGIKNFKPYHGYSIKKRIYLWLRKNFS